MFAGMIVYYLYVLKYVAMYIGKFACSYVCIHVFTWIQDTFMSFANGQPRISLYQHLCMYVCMFVCIYVCIYVYMYIFHVCLTIYIAVMHILGATLIMYRLTYQVLHLEQL